MVTVDGQTYKSHEFCSTLKEAEHAASRISLISLMLNGVLEDESDDIKWRFAASTHVASSKPSAVLSGQNSKTIPPLDIPLPGFINPSLLPDYVQPSI